MKKLIPITGFATVSQDVTEEAFRDWLLFIQGKQDPLPADHPLYNMEPKQILSLMIEYC